MPHTHTNTQTQLHIKFSNSSNVLNILCTFKSVFAGPYDAPQVQRSTWRGLIRGVSSPTHRGGHLSEHVRGPIRGRDDGSGGYVGHYGSPAGREYGDGFGGPHYGGGYGGPHNNGPHHGFGGPHPGMASGYGDFCEPPGVRNRYGPTIPNGERELGIGDRGGVDRGYGGAGNTGYLGSGNSISCERANAPASGYAGNSSVAGPTANYGYGFGSDERGKYSGIPATVGVYPAGTGYAGNAGFDSPAVTVPGNATIGGDGFGGVDRGAGFPGYHARSNAPGGYEGTALFGQQGPTDFYGAAAAVAAAPIAAYRKKWEM
eukprot:GHVR01012079.1.p1 GENE.GHVR01012079.1~~GHVR01012079.1.p1  ORF type:complete len:316 (-),score=57.19 GHVR01012079.1:206-1153(-)